MASLLDVRQAEFRMRNFGSFEQQWAWQRFRMRNQQVAVKLLTPRRFRMRNLAAPVLLESVTNFACEIARTNKQGILLTLAQTRISHAKSATDHQIKRSSQVSHAKSSRLNCTDEGRPPARRTRFRMRNSNCLAVEDLNFLSKLSFLL